MFTCRDVDGRLYVVDEASGERWCEVLGNVGVDRRWRSRFIALALRAAFAMNALGIEFDVRTSSERVRDDQARARALMQKKPHRVVADPASAGAPSLET